MSIKKTFYLDHLGCAKNQVDSEVIMASLEEKGWQESAIEEAGLIIINTCGFIESAKKESIDHFFSAHEHYPEAKIILAGCLAQRYGQDLKAMLPEASGIFGANSPEKIIDFVEMIEKQDGVVWIPDACFSRTVTRKKRLSLEGSAYLKIAEGCSNRCRFCAIPLIRGNTRSRPIDDIVKEFKDLLAMGVYEINLVAQDLSSFGRDFEADQLLPLLKSLSEIKGDFWVRLLYIHPDRFPLELLPFMQNDKRFLPYFDLPFQHASAKVLKSMGRWGSKEAYLDLIHKIRLALPQAVVRSTFLFGFPGETEADFQEVMDFQQQAKLDWAGAFAYSREEDTAAYDEAGDEKLAVDPAVAERRVELFMQNQSAITEKQLERYIGKEYEALIEEAVEETSLWLARIYACAPEVDGLVVVESSKPLRVGQHVPVKITKVTGVDLAAKAL